MLIKTFLFVSYRLNQNKKKSTSKKKKNIQKINIYIINTHFLHCIETE